MKFSITKDMLRKSLTKAGPKWLSLTDDIIENTYSGAQSAVDKALDTAAKEGLTGKKLRAAGQEAYDDFIQQAQHDISSDLFDQKINSIIDSRFNGKFNNLTIVGNAETGAGIADDIWNKYLGDKGLYSFSSQELDETIANELNTIQSHVGNYRAQQAKATGLLNKEIAEQRMANLPDPREGIGEIQQQIRMNKYWEEQDAKIAQIKANSQTDLLAAKLSGASETFEGTAAAEELNANTAATLDSINRGTFFTSGLGRVQSTLDVQTSAISPVTNGLGGINLLTNPEINPIAFGSNQSVQKARQNILKADLEAKHYAGKTADEIRYDKYMRQNAQYSGSNTEKAALEKQNTETPWSRGAKIALGTAVTGAALCAALSSSRGQQNNAQLYGQQPLY